MLASRRLPEPTRLLHRTSQSGKRGRLLWEKGGVGREGRGGVGSCAGGGGAREVLWSRRGGGCDRKGTNCLDGRQGGDSQRLSVTLYEVWHALLGLAQAGTLGDKSGTSGTRPFEGSAWCCLRGAPVQWPPAQCKAGTHYTARRRLLRWLCHCCSALLYCSDALLASRCFTLLHARRRCLCFSMCSPARTRSNLAPAPAAPHPRRRPHAHLLHAHDSADPGS